MCVVVERNNNLLVVSSYVFFNQEQTRLRNQQLSMGLYRMGASYI